MSIDGSTANNENEPINFEMIGDSAAPQCIDGACDIPDSTPVDSTTPV